jgi:ribonuclease E
MLPSKHQREVERRLRDALKVDRARVQVGRISRFGLLEMSRQRLRPSLGESSQLVCPRCEGHGHIRNTDSLALSILRLMEEEAMKEMTGHVIVQAPVPVATFLLNEKREAISNIQQRRDITLTIVPNPHMDTPHYDIIRVRSDEVESIGLSYEHIQKLPHTTDDSRAEAKAAPQPIDVPVVGNVIPNQPAPHARRITDEAVVAERGPNLIRRILGGLFGTESNLESTRSNREDRKPRDDRRNRKSTPEAFETDDIEAVERTHRKKPSRDEAEDELDDLYTERFDDELTEVEDEEARETRQERQPRASRHERNNRQRNNRNRDRYEAPKEAEEAVETTAGTNEIADDTPIEITLPAPRESNGNNRNGRGRNRRRGKRDDENTTVEADANDVVETSEVITADRLELVATSSENDVTETTGDEVKTHTSEEVVSTEAPLFAPRNPHNRRRSQRYRTRRENRPERGAPVVDEEGNIPAWAADDNGDYAADTENTRDFNTDDEYQRYEPELVFDEAVKAQANTTYSPEGSVIDTVQDAPIVLTTEEQQVSFVFTETAIATEPVFDTVNLAVFQTEPSVVSADDIHPIVESEEKANEVVAVPATTEQTVETTVSENSTVETTESVISESTPAAPIVAETIESTPVIIENSTEPLSSEGIDATQAPDSGTEAETPAEPVMTIEGERALDTISTIKFDASAVSEVVEIAATETVNDNYTPTNDVLVDNVETSAIVVKGHSTEESTPSVETAIPEVALSAAEEVTPPPAPVKKLPSWMHQPLE